MKILFVNEKCGFFGGVEQNIADSAAGLRALGHRCYLAYGENTLRASAAYTDAFDGRFQVKGLTGEEASGGADHFADIFERLQPDVVYLHKLPDLRSVRHCLKKSHTVRMVHDHDLCCPRRHKYFALNGRVCNQAAGWRCWLDGAFVQRRDPSSSGVKFINIQNHLEEMRRNFELDLLLVGSRFMRQELLQNGFPENRIHVLAPLARFPSIKPTAVPDAPRLLYVGQLVRGKGVDLWLEALSLLQCRFEADIVGTGNAEAELQSQCRRLGLGDRVRFRGWVEHEMLPQFYARAKVVVVPSRWPEPFGMIGLEAMLQGRPVVGFDVGGISDWLVNNENGLLVSEQNTAALAAAIEKLLSDTTTAARMGQNGRRKAESEFSFSRYIHQLESYLTGSKYKARLTGLASSETGLDSAAVHR